MAYKTQKVVTTTGTVKIYPNMGKIFTLQVSLQGTGEYYIKSSCDQITYHLHPDAQTINTTSRMVSFISPVEVINIEFPTLSGTAIITLLEV
jgi:hypothetical protein